ncbi:hypothetical protein [Butyrivibrio sp.]|uniref:hypothetical protein n=1 Tax=Butyrivibrio sp. TaxID=28121 RepID=UPI0025C11176|nr:hypothetical protein [Butyrivibrio sp.]MBQ9302305.1 hypothetical protein [Butyrivibrio sp.]
MRRKHAGYPTVRRKVLHNNRFEEFGDMVTERKISRWKNKYCLAKYTLSNAGIEKMMELMSLTDKIAKEGRSSRRSIWVNVPNKTDNGDWVNIRFCGAVYGPGDVFYEVMLDDISVMSYDSKRTDRNIVDITDMLDGLIDCVNKVLSLVENGEYESYITKVPYERRRGVIPRTDYYDIVPEARKDYVSSLSQDEINELMESGGCTDYLEENMTARRFYEACTVVYEALGLSKEKTFRVHCYEDSKAERAFYSGMTPKEWYYQIADGRDDGLYMVPMDDPVHFLGWLRRDADYFDYKYLGGHEWDFILKYSTGMQMMVVEDSESGKCIIRITGDSMARSDDLIRAFLALRRAGYAVMLQGYKVLLGRLKETDYVGIVEFEKNLWQLDAIAGHDVRDSICLCDFKDDSIVEEIIKATEWEDLDAVRLA